MVLTLLVLKGAYRTSYTYRPTEPTADSKLVAADRLEKSLMDTKTSIMELGGSLHASVLNRRSKKLANYYYPCNGIFQSVGGALVVFKSEFLFFKRGKLRILTVA